MKICKLALTILLCVSALAIVSSCKFLREVKHETIVVYDTLKLALADSLFRIPADSVVLKEPNAAMIVVDKEKMSLSVLGFKSDTLFSVPMCCGHQFGDKRTTADDRTPEGVFKVRRVEDSSLWEHKLKDGSIEYGSYGPIFIRLDYPPMYRIGIHGTNLNNSLGKRQSEGCVRISNENIVRLARYAYVGMPVVITPGKKDISANAEVLSANN